MDINRGGLCKVATSAIRARPDPTAVAALIRRPALALLTHPRTHPLLTLSQTGATLLSPTPTRSPRLHSPSPALLHSPSPALLHSSAWRRRPARRGTAALSVRPARAMAQAMARGAPDLRRLLPRALHLDFASELSPTAASTSEREQRPSRAPRRGPRARGRRGPEAPAARTRYALTASLADPSSSSFTSSVFQIWRREDDDDHGGERFR